MRFVFEAAFLLLVALGAALMELRPLAIILLMGCAWVLVALIERASSRDAGRAPVDEGEAEELPPAEGETAPEPAVLAAPPVSRWSWRRRTAEEPSPTAALDARPSRSHVRRVEPSQEADVGLGEPEAQAEAEISAQPDEVPGPVVTKRPLDLPGLEQPQPVSIPAPRPRRSLARAARRVVQPPAQPATPPPPPPPAREWNLWDLERRAREQAGNAPRDEEWSALFTHLRGFANADGVLPKEFDELVRESFGELIEAA